MIDVNALISDFPFRWIPTPTPTALLAELDRLEIDRAWVGYLPSAYHRDPSPDNDILVTALQPMRDRLLPVPTVRPDWPDWQRQLARARDTGAVAVRVYPPQWQMGPQDERLAGLAVACGELKLPLMLTVRFEDLRQRHPLDSAGDLSAAHIRHVARAGADVRLIVTAAGKDLIEEVHWGLTAAEQQRILWDISWIWGPPEDHLAKLIDTIGGARFVYGSQWPLRLAEGPGANIDLLPDGVTVKGRADTLFD